MEIDRQRRPRIGVIVNKLNGTETMRQFRDTLQNDSPPLGRGSPDVAESDIRGTDMWVTQNVDSPISEPTLNHVRGSLSPPSTAALSPPSVPLPNHEHPSVSTAAPSTSVSTLAPAPTLAPESRTPHPSSAQPPYTHPAHNTRMSSSSPDAAGASSSEAAAMLGVAIGSPANPREAQTSIGSTVFVPPPPLADQFNPMLRDPGQPPAPAPQVRISLFISFFCIRGYDEYRE
jgi:hypothetical protein